MKPRCFSVFIMLISSMLLIGTVTAKTSIADNLDSPRLLQATAATTIRVSVASDGTQANNKSWGSTISSNGQYIAFYSDANNLVSGDSNSSSDIFVYSWQTGQTTRVSVASNGAQGNGHSYSPAISGDGRYIAFESEASNLVTGDTNGQRDIFVHDQQTGQTTRVSVASDGTQGDSWAYTASISADGRYVAFGSFSALFVSGDTNNQPDIFVHDRQTGTTTRISVASDGTEGNGRSDRAIVSSDGRYITFDSEATNLVSGDTNGNVDVFIHDRQTGETNRVSVGPGGVQGDQGSSSHSLSADGRYVVFGSSATNMVNGDTNNQQDIFVHDRQTGNTSRVSVASDGAEGNNSSSLAAASSDGRYIVFDSLASNLIPDDTNGVWDTFVHDQQTGETIRISIASGGLEGNGRTIGGSISADGHYIAFDSEASNLVPNDTNGSYDVFLHDREGILLPAPITDLQASTGSGQGQIELVWTAPQNINSNMNYQIRYASSPIASELGWTSAMAVMDVPVPADAGTVQNMTVTNLTPAQTYYFAIRVEYEPDNLSALSNSPGAAAANAPDLLFRPNPDGYQFVNPGYMQPTCSDFQRSYSGLSIQCTNNQPQQEYQALFKDYRSTFSTGICTGMAVSSLLYYTGAEPHPQPGTIFELDVAQAQANIATYHGRQHSKAVLDIVVPSWKSWTDDSAVISQRVDDVYNQIKASLSSGNNNPLVLDLFPRENCGKEGHTVVPYRLDATDPVHPKVYVYENFNPGNADKFIQFDFSTPIHRFSYSQWDSASLTSCGVLVAVPINAFTSFDAKIPGTQLHVSTGGNVEPLLTNSTGEMLGYNNGELTVTITDAMPVFPWFAPGITSTVTSFLAPPDMYTTTLSSSGGGYTFTVWSSSGTLELQADGQTTPLTNNLLSTTNPDLISFDADLHSAVLSTSDAQGQSVTLQMSIPDTDDSQVYTIDNVNLLAGGNLNVDALDSELRLTSNSISTNYDVYFDRISTQTLSAFAHANLTLLASDKHYLTFSDEEDALLQIDHGGDGSIDETIVLENQADTFYKIYLPTILR